MSENVSQKSLEQPALEQKENKMTLIEHFDELRKRLLIIVIGLVVGVLISFIFAERAIQFLAKPVGGLENLQSIEVTENMGVFMRVSVLSGFILSLPLTLYEVVAFILPALKPEERKWLFIAIPALFIMFVAGVAFTYLIMLPAAIPFLTKFLGVETVPRLSNYIGFVTNLMFWIGLIFETPLVMFLLTKLHVVTPKLLLKGWRVAVITSAVLAAVITPTVVPVNMGLLMAPMLGLYLLSVLMSVIAQ